MISIFNIHLFCCIHFKKIIHLTYFKNIPVLEFEKFLGPLPRKGICRQLQNTGLWCHSFPRLGSSICLWSCLTYKTLTVYLIVNSKGVPVNIMMWETGVPAFFTFTLDGANDQLHALITLCQRKSPWYVLYRGLGGPHSQSGHFGEWVISCPHQETNHYSSVVQPVAHLLHRMSYPALCIIV